MSRLYLLDTNTVIYILKGRSAVARARLAGLGTGDVACISAVTEGELRYGVAKAENGKKLQTSLDWSWRGAGKKPQRTECFAPRRSGWANRWPPSIPRSPPMPWLWERWWSQTTGRFNRSTVCSVSKAGRRIYNSKTEMGVDGSVQPAP